MEVQGCLSVHTFQPTHCISNFVSTTNANVAWQAISFNVV